MMLFVIVTIVNSGCSKDNKMSFDETWTNRHEEQMPMVMESNLESIDGQKYIYPLQIIIEQDSIVQLYMDSAWTMMNRSCNLSGRREYGFWIYYHCEDSTFWCGEIAEGELIDYKIGSGASIALPQIVNYIEVCAFCHTHTSLHYAPDGMCRTTGPSPRDITTANSWQIPGFVIDYKDSIIFSGHSLNDSSKIYYFGPENRTYVIY